MSYEVKQEEIWFASGKGKGGLRQRVGAIFLPQHKIKTETKIEEKKNEKHEEKKSEPLQEQKLEDFQQQPWLIIVHGAFEFKENWYDFCRFLAGRGIRCLVFDLHGHGGSEGPRHHVHLDTWIQDIEYAILFTRHFDENEFNSKGSSSSSNSSGHRKTLVVSPVFLYGFSSGGTAVYEAVLRGVSPFNQIQGVITQSATVSNALSCFETCQYRLVLSLLCCCCAETKMDQSKKFKSLSLVCDKDMDKKLKEDPRMIAGWAAFPLTGAQQSTFVETYSHLHLLDPRINQLVLWGKEDGVDDPKQAKKIYDAIPLTAFDDANATISTVGRKQLVMLDETGHFAHVDQHRLKLLNLVADWVLEITKQMP